MCVCGGGGGGGEGGVVYTSKPENNLTHLKSPQLFCSWPCLGNFGTILLF